MTLNKTAGFFNDESVIKILIIIYIAVCLLMSISTIGSFRGKIRLFIINILMTPIGGAIYSGIKKKKKNMATRYLCRNCNFQFDEKPDECAICKKNTGFKKITVTLDNVGALIEK